MKYLKQGLVESGAMRLLIIEVICSVIYLWINAMILLWISNLISEPENAWHWVLLITVGCIITTALDCVEKMLDIGRHRLFTWLNNEIGDKILSADVGMFSEIGPGEVSHAASQLWLISSYVYMVLAVIKSAIEVIVNVVMVIVLAKLMSIFVIAISFGSTLLIYVINQKWEKIDKEIDGLKSVRNCTIDEICNGFLDVRSFSGAVKSHHDSIHNSNDGILKLIKSRQGWSAVMSLVFQSGASIAMAAAIMYALGVTTQGIMPLIPSSAVSLVMYTWRLSDPLASIAFRVAEFTEAKSAIPAFAKIMDYRNKVIDGEIEFNGFQDKIELEHVSFAYGDSDTVLSDINLTIPKGSRIGICGKSGGGKSTLIKLIPRYYDVDSGVIKFDGVNVKRYKRDFLIRHIGVVSPHIFDTTIRENIAYGLIGKPILESELIEACRKAAILDFIQSLPEGFDTNVGPRGLKLSGGQKQRISLARIFLADPEIILLDEATSALDNETEAVIQTAIDELQNKTLIIVAHRLSTIRDCDQIVVIDNHKIAEAGTHDELVDRGGIYASMLR